MSNPPSFYDILQISPKASDEEIKRAYRMQAKTYHPDLNPQNRRLAELRLKLINEAYSAVKTLDKRLAYNRTLRRKPLNDNKDNQKNDKPKPASLISRALKIFTPPPPKPRAEDA